VKPIETVESAVRRGIEEAYKRGFDAGVQHQREAAPPLRARELKKQLDAVQAERDRLLELITSPCELERELLKLEATDPAVATAKAKLDRVVVELTSPKSAHTPGPMVFDEEQGEVVMQVDGDKLRVRIPYARRTGSVVYGGAALGAEMQANGRLFAAAPELLAAIREFLAGHAFETQSSGGGCPCHACGTGHAAIAKAEGRE